MTFLTIRIFGDGQHVGLYFWRWPTLGRGPLDVTIMFVLGRTERVLICWKRSQSYVSAI